jgi:hypothetical protein
MVPIEVITAGWQAGARWARKDVVLTLVNHYRETINVAICAGDFRHGSSYGWFDVKSGHARGLQFDVPRIGGLDVVIHGQLVSGKNPWRKETSVAFYTLEHAPFAIRAARTNTPALYLCSGKPVVEYGKLIRVTGNKTFTFT